MENFIVSFPQGHDVVFKMPRIPRPVKPKPVHNVTPFAIFDDSVRDAPLNPLSEPNTSTQELKEEEEEEEEEEIDMSTTIYYENFEKAPIVDEDESQEESDNQEWENEMMCSFIATTDNRYEYTIVQEEKEMSSKIRHGIEMSNGNPFNETLRNLIIEQCNFEFYLEAHVPQCKLLKSIPKLKPGMQLEIQEEIYTAGKFIAKGSFGSIFIIENTNTKKTFAAKQEKPANLWEYYICMELSDRLKTNNLDHMIKAFMHINKAVIANNSSIFISELSPFGTIIDVCNKVRKITGKNLDEYIAMILTCQILSIIDFLHGCKIVHADVKPDNFLLMKK
jgi:Protein kinase domain